MKWCLVAINICLYTSITIIFKFFIKLNIHSIFIVIKIIDMIIVIILTNVTRVPYHPWTRTTPVFPFLRPSNEWNLPHFYNHFMQHPSILVCLWVPCWVHPFGKVLIVGQECDRIVRQRFFFLFLGWIFLPLCDKKLGMNHKNDFCEKKKWQSDHIFKAKKKRINRHIFKIGSNRSPKQKYSTISEFSWDLGFRTSTNGQIGSRFQDFDRWTDGI
jgi:hypothetical protein